MEDSQTIADLVLDRAIASGSEAMILYDDVTVSGQSLAEEVERAAERHSCCAKGDVVLLGGGRSVELLADYCAIRQAGAAPVFVDPASPAKRLEAIRKSCEHIGNLDTAQVAYIGSTSGSLGVPKLVPISENALRSRIFGGQVVAKLNNNDVVLWHASTAFDFSIWEMLAPIVLGCRQRIYHGGPKLLMDDLLDALHDVSVLHMTPTVASEFVNVAGASGRRFDALRLVLLGGEILYWPLVEAIREVNSDLSIINQYGPTEACIDVTGYTVPPRPEDTKTSAIVPVGRPIPDTVVQLDIEGTWHSSATATANTVGEVLLSGPQVAHQYLVEVPGSADPFWRGESGFDEPVYRTGDAGYFDAQANLVITGRLDDQLNIGGIRLERSEIDSVVGKHIGSVKHALLAAFDGGTPIVVFEESEVATASLTDLRSDLVDSLPSGAIPRLIPVETIPVLPNGKIDRPAVQLLLGRQRSVVGERIDDGRDVAAEVIRVVQSVLGLDVSRTDNFFDVGGHSMMAAEVIVALSETYEIELDLRDFFEAETITTYIDHLIGTVSDHWSD